MKIEDYIEATVPHNIDHFYLTRDEMVTTLTTCWRIAQKEREKELDTEVV